MTERWRWLDLDRQGPYENAATMPVLVRSVMTSGEPTAQTSVWGSTHLNVGWFDDVDSTVDLDLCAELGLEVVRRQFYGGGTAFYAAEAAMMWGFLLPKGYDAHGGSEGLDAQLRRFQEVISDALGRVGLAEVQFEGSSDLRWHGRKLGALTAQDVVGCDSIGGFLNLARPDLTTYLRVVRVPEDKFKDKIVKDMSEYVCTAEEVAGHPVTYEAMRDAMRAAMAAADIDWVHSELNEGERKGVAKGSARVGDPAMVRRISSDRFRREAPEGSRVGLANHKGRKLVRAGVAIDADDNVVAALMAGDMHVSPPDTLDRIADALLGAAARDADDLRSRIATVFEGDDVTQAEEVMGVTTDDLLTAVVKAVGVAMDAEPAAAADGGR
jgi:lipoate-protein ligase A